VLGGVFFSGIGTLVLIGSRCLAARHLRSDDARPPSRRLTERSARHRGGELGGVPQGWNGSAGEGPSVELVAPSRVGDTKDPADVAASVYGR